MILREMLLLSRPPLSPGLLIRVALVAVKAVFSLVHLRSKGHHTFFFPMITEMAIIKVSQGLRAGQEALLFSCLKRWKRQAHYIQLQRKNSHLCWWIERVRVCLSQDTFVEMSSVSNKQQKQEEKKYSIYTKLFFKAYASTNPRDGVDISNYKSPIQDLFPSHSQFSKDRLWIHPDPDPDPNVI